MITFERMQFPIVLPGEHTCAMNEQQESEQIMGPCDHHAIKWEGEKESCCYDSLAISTTKKVGKGTI